MKHLAPQSGRLSYFRYLSPRRHCSLTCLLPPVSHSTIQPKPSTMASSSSNVVGVHYRVGKKIGEGSFGVIFEGTNLLNNQQVAIKFVSLFATKHSLLAGSHKEDRNRGRATLRSFETNTVHTRSWSAAVSDGVTLNRRSYADNVKLGFPMCTILDKKACTTFW